MILYGSSWWRRTCAIARSIRGSPLRLRLYVMPPASPTPVKTRPWRIRSIRSWFVASQVMEPMVPGINRNRYENFLGIFCNARPRWVATAIPDKLSLQRDGWQQCTEIRISSPHWPGRRHSPYVRWPGSSDESIQTSYSVSANSFSWRWLRQNPQFSL